MRALPTGCEAKILLIPGAEPALTAAYVSYPLVCDEVLSEVRSRLVAHGAATKVDLAALVFWKHINNARWMADLLNVPDTTVRAATAAAFAPIMTDQERVLALAPLKGFGAGGAITSILFAAWDPQRFGVYDRLALAARERVVSDDCTCDWDYLPTYWEHLRRLAGELSVAGGTWSPRMVDMALFKLAP
jgi:cell division FtsZ-interacting protein ZapD